MENKIKRRTFIRSTVIGLSGLTLGIYPDVMANPEGSTDLYNWLNISEDNQITINVAKAELGQGVSTSLPMLIAEEMEADWNTIQVELKAEYGRFIHTSSSGFTTKSDSIKTLYLPFRKMGAAVKELLMTACAKKWQVPVNQLHIENSIISHPTKGSLTFGELVNETRKLSIPQNPKLKDPKDFKLIGKPIRRLDIKDHVEGKTVFGADVRLPDMLYGAVVQSPIIGGEVANFKALRADGKQIVKVPGGIVVVAKSYWEAQKAARSLKIKYKSSAEMAGLSHLDIAESVAKDLKKAGKQLRLENDPKGALRSASQRLESKYSVPLLAHAQLETQVCTARISGDVCELWLPTQAPIYMADFIKATGIKFSNIVMHATQVGGSFGRKDFGDYVVQAVLAAKATGKAVQVIWSRKEEMQHDFYRPIFQATFQAGTDKNRITSLTAKTSGPVLFYDLNTSAMGLADLPYHIPNLDLQTVDSRQYVCPDGYPCGGLTVANWRGVGYTQNIFFVESFMDELAHKCGEDPLAFRRKHLKDKRSIQVLDKVAEMSNWSQKRSPGKGKGVSFAVLHGTILAQVADVTVDKRGKTTVDKVFCALDCGLAVNPDIVVAQIEGGINYGISAALYNEITIHNGRIRQTNFHNYRVTTMKDAPEVDVEIINSGAQLGGIGEIGTPMTFPAITNAVFAATGKRVRDLPISKHKLA